MDLNISAYYKLYWHTILCKFKVHDVLMWYLYTLKWWIYKLLIYYFGSGIYSLLVKPEQQLLYEKDSFLSILVFSESGTILALKKQSLTSWLSILRAPNDLDGEANFKSLKIHDNMYTFRLFQDRSLTDGFSSLFLVQEDACISFHHVEKFKIKTVT